MTAADTAHSPTAKTSRPALWEVRLVDLNHRYDPPVVAHVYADSDQGAHDVALAGRPINIILDDYPVKVD